MTVTVLLHVLLQPAAFTIVSVSVNVPAEPAVTLTDWLVLEPTMLPLPEIDQLYEAIPAGAL